jgi:hypothetical protein
MSSQGRTPSEGLDGFHGRPWLAAAGGLEKYPTMFYKNRSFMHLHPTQVDVFLIQG